SLRNDSLGTRTNIEKVEEAIRVFHEQHIWPNPRSPEVSSITVLHGMDRSVILKSTDSVVTQVSTYASIGIGAYVTDHWKQLLLPYDEALTLDHLVALAIYLIWQAKENVDGCDRWTSVAAFKRGGEFGWGLAPPMPVIEPAFRKIQEAYAILIRSLI